MNSFFVYKKNIKNLNWFYEILAGFVVFLVPFFSILSPTNLKQIFSKEIFEISISLVFVLVILFAVYHLTSIVILKLWGKKITGLFSLYCFGFYLLFLYQLIKFYIAPHSKIVIIALLIFWVHVGISLV